MQRYFIDHPLTVNDEFQMASDDSHHLVKVLRSSIGDEVEIVDSKRRVFLAEVVDIQADTILTATKDITKAVELPIEVTIACGISKGDKNEQIIKRATELGAQHFLFFESRYSVAKWAKSKTERKLKRLGEVAKSAAEQAHRQMIPTVEIVEESQLLEMDFDDRLVAYEESAKQGEQSNFKKVISNLAPGDRLVAVFGPEGGFSKEEVDKFAQSGFTLAGLGPRILRAETAPMYVMATLSYQFELR